MQMITDKFEKELQITILKKNGEGKNARFKR